MQSLRWPNMTTVTTHIEIALPEGDGTFPFQKLNEFVFHCKSLGAEDDTPVTAVSAAQEPSIVIGLRVDFEQMKRHSPCIEVTREAVDDLLQLFESIALNEYDARKSENEIARLHRLLSEFAIYP